MGRWRKRRAAALLIGAVLLLVSIVGDALAQSERRVALVLGNGAYQSAPKLRNPPNDARAMAAKLRGLGFEVVESVDADQRKLREALTVFAAKLEGAAAGLLFYSGHGLQVAGQNYLIPIEAKLQREADLYVQTVTVSDVLRIMEATVPVRLVFLDACRDNPLARRLAGSMGSARSQAVGQGLAKIDAAIGTLIAYATAPGDTAEDGEGTANSPFTTALLQHLDAPGLEVSQVLKRVRGAVLTTTKNRQVPWDSSSLVGDFYFKAAIAPAPAPAPSTPLPDRETVFWQSVHPGDDASGYEEYLRQFPKGLYAGLARNRVKALKQQLAALVPPRVEAPTVTKPAMGTYDLSPGKAFKDCAECPEMVVIPAGSYMMGATATERSWYLGQGGKEKWAISEQPQHVVKLGAAFAMAKLEVSRGQFARFAGATGRRMDDGCRIPGPAGWETDNGKSWRDPGFGQVDDHPVVCVSWEDANAYARWLSRETGQEYRLPTEAEWEYAARGSGNPTGSMRYWGDDPANKDMCGFANIADKTMALKFPTWSTADCVDSVLHTAPGGRFRPNAFGLHDMLGNVWEWVQDSHHESYVGAPADGRAWDAGTSAPFRMVRGGSWDADPWYLRAAARFRFAPGYRGAGTGFRVARTLAP